MSRILHAVAAGALAAGVLVAGGPAQAAPTTEPYTCDDEITLIRTNENNSSDRGGWGVGQTADGHLIPIAFSGSAFDVTQGFELFTFEASKGNGHANHRQSTVTCTSSFTGTLADFVEPGQELPPGASLTDVVTFDFEVVAVAK